MVGFLLSPLSWWNDLLINVPLAYLVAWPVAWLHPALFWPAFVVGYWLTNVLGLWLLHRGVLGLAQVPKTISWVENGLMAVAYTLLIALLVWLGWLPLPAG